MYRRKFLQAGFLSSAVVFGSGCSFFGIGSMRETLIVVQEDLFPKAQSLGIDTSEYLTIILRHSRVSQEEKDFLKNGVKWLNEEAFTLYNKKYTALSRTKREAVLETISQMQWGENWIYTLLNYIFEAMLGDPVYRSNRSEAAWKWLAFEGGVPRARRPFL